MAQMRIEDGYLVVELSRLEQLGALSRGVRMPLAQVRSVEVTETPYRELRGMRVGTGVPWVVVLGRMVSFDGTDFVAVYGTGRTAVVELAEGAKYRRIMVSDPDDSVIARLRGTLGSVAQPV